MTDVTYPFADLALARRLERAEASSNAESVEARARLWPSSGARWLEVAGAYAMFDGPASPLTQTFGLGLFEDTERSSLDRIERFFEERGAGVFHEVSPLAGPLVATLLVERGYKPVEFTSVTFRPIGRAEDHGRSVPGAEPAHERVTVRVAGSGDQEVWSRTAIAGWSEFREVEAFMRDVGRVAMATPHATCFLAEFAGEPIATAIVTMHRGVALLAGASTVPDRRGRGAQRALLDARLRHGAAHGCDLAMMCAAPGSASQRNAERHGFRIAYTRLKWGR